MTLGRRHALGLGLLLALVVEPPVLQPFVSAQSQQPDRGVKAARLRLLGGLEREAQKLKTLGAWTVVTEPGSRAEPPD